MALLANVLKGLLRPGDPYTLTTSQLKGSGRTPSGWSREFVTIKVDRPNGPAIYNATRSAWGDIYLREGRPHRLSGRNKTREAWAHPHRTPDGRMRDTASGIAKELGIKNNGTFGVPRSRLSDGAIVRELTAQSKAIQATSVIANDTWKAHGFGKQVSAVFDRQSADLTRMVTTAKNIQTFSRNMRVEAARTPRGLSTAAKNARGAWFKAAEAAETAAKKAGKAGEAAARATAKASEASAKAAADAAEATAKASIAAAEEAAKQAAKAAEQAAKIAASTAEAAAKAGVAAAEATAKATLATAEAAVKATAAAAAAVAAAAASALDG